ncbi:MAG: T9SS type A sorting domain-containing protein [Bacteroides sp.]|nr:T9SS type A sorting domain-containing protein [Bacteroides sp.]
MKPCLRLLIALVMATCAAVTPVMAAPVWGPVKTERTDAKQVIKETELEIKSASGTIIVTSNHPVQIKVFTILGRLVNSETLPAGSSQLSLPAHGVYIVKIGDITCKVAV